MGHPPISPSSMPTYQSRLASAVTNHEPPSSQARHLKRSPAHLSVCLRPTPSKRLKPMTRSHVGTASMTMSASSSNLLVTRSHRTRQIPTRHISTFAGMKRANAEKWFHESNQNPTRTPHAFFIDNDPPFYLHDHSSSNMDSACAVQSDRHAQSRFNTPPHPGRPGRIRSSDSTSEEFRGVIDDLTVKNKKLREKLKKYERLHCSHLQEEKLFEVRVHGLPMHRKLELEQVLRGFATSLEESPDAPGFAPISEPATILLDPLPPLHKKPCSSSTSYSKPHDSTYASVSASGQTLNSQPNPNHVRSLEKSESKRRDVRSYLHDIPPGLLPRRSPFISTQVKRKVVVRRLEQLFTGRGGVIKNCHRSHQQQEVSQSAAQVERGANGAGEGRLGVEGVREARILPATTFHFAADSNPSSHARDHHEGEERKFGSELPSHEGTPDQRPTRPLDLDLHRAQVPAENIQYIKHLGISSPVAEPNAEVGFLKGWVYLNLLVGMAQLHTLNVTLGFIRKAIAEISTKFELSADGRKIRWIGDDQGTPLSSDSDESTDSTRGMLPDKDPTAARQKPIGGRRLRQLRSEAHSDAIDTSRLSTYNSSPDYEEAHPQPFCLAPSNSATSFHYKPLLFRRISSEDEDCYNYDDDDSYSLSRKVEHSNVLESFSRGPQAPVLKSNKVGRQEGGPIIFYRNANFCTDLSGDLNHDSRNDVSFTRYIQDPIGGNDESHGGGETGHDPEETLVHEPDSVEVETESSCLTDTCLTLGEMSLVDAEDAPSRIKPVYFEVSGLGGVQPQDNFCVEVKMQHGGLKSPDDDGSEHGTPDQSPPRGLRQSRFSPAGEDFHWIHTPRANQADGSFCKSKILSLTVTPLPHSVLPEPSYINLPFSSDNEEEDEGSSENSECDEKQKGFRSFASDEMGTELDKPRPLAALFGLLDDSSVENWHTTLSEGSDDSSIDILAHARVLDPETVAAREREYDSNMGMPLAEVPAGSSAATAGGGSGHPSEASSPCSESTEEKKRSGRPSVKRRRL